MVPGFISVKHTPRKEELPLPLSVGRSAHPFGDSSAPAPDEQRALQAGHRTVFQVQAVTTPHRFLHFLATMIQMQTRASSRGSSRNICATWTLGPSAHMELSCIQPAGGREVSSHGPAGHTLSHCCIAWETIFRVITAESSHRKMNHL